MFTGIITAIGTIEKMEQRGDAQVRIACPYDPADMAIGASIACAGVCLTVTDRGGEAGKAWFAADISGETMACTTASGWQLGTKLNLERALKIGDEIGGHIVTGHVDSVGEVAAVKPEGQSTRLAVRASRAISPFIAEKGSITLDGVSLTVNDIRDRSDGTCDFALNVIPHTAEMTTLGALKVGDATNLEIDVLARYLKRMSALRG